MRRTLCALLAANAALAACATVPASQVAAPAAPAADPAVAAAPQPPGRMQWLYGSGEGAAASIQAYHAFRDFALAAAKARPRRSVVLLAGGATAEPRFETCGNKPPAVVLDVDETVLLNLGYEYDEAVSGRSFSPERWAEWERTGARMVAPVPGAVTTLRALRQAGITVIFNSNREAVNAAGTIAALAGVGLGPAVPGDTLWLRGDAGGGSGKDLRRAAISARYCVVAMAGDQLGDFSDHFNASQYDIRTRRDVANSQPWAGLWGEGWFLIPNPVYGSGVRGGFDDVFPADKRWPAAAAPATQGDR